MFRPVFDLQVIEDSQNVGCEEVIKFDEEEFFLNEQSTRSIMVTFKPIELAKMTCRYRYCCLHIIRLDIHFII